MWGHRASGASDRPMTEGQVVPFKSPVNLSVEVKLPNRGTVRGLGIRTGVTLIVGGGFHGKSTLLKAIEAGVYNKVGQAQPCYVSSDADQGHFRRDGIQV